jgi:membrane protein implicated in regulation of membrane protease activity
MKALRVLKYAGFAILGIGFITLAVFVIMSLWNALIPSLFHGPVLTFWQTAGLFLLSKILLTGVAPGRHNSRSRDCRSKDRRDYYKERFRKEFHQDPEEISPEQA